jgi:hypothetical protein
MPYVPWGHKPIVNLSDLRLKRAGEEFMTQMRRIAEEGGSDADARWDAEQRKYKKALRDYARANPGRC